MVRLIHILGNLWLLACVAPVNACMLSEWAFGTSCHDAASTASAVVGAAAADGCAPDPDGGHDQHCVCAWPDFAADRPQQDTSVLPDLVASAPVSTCVPMSPLGDLADLPFRPPDVPAPPAFLPMLN